MGNNASSGGHMPPSTRKSTAHLRAHLSNGSSSSSSNQPGHESYRKSSANQQNHNLEDEFNDMILHEVSKQQQQQQQQQQHNPLIPVSSTGSNATPIPSHPQRGHSQSNPVYNQFTNDLIEDEFNELNDGLLETDATELSRNIIPNHDSNPTSSGSNTGNHSDNDYSDHTNTTNNDATNAAGFAGDHEFMDIDHNYSHSDIHHSMSLDQFSPSQTPGDASQSVHGEIHGENSSIHDETPTPDLSKVDFTKIVAPTADVSHRDNDEYLQQQQLHHQHQNQPHHSLHQRQQQRNHQQQTIDYVSKPGSHSSSHSSQKQIPVEIKWVNTTKEVISKIAIIGSFSNWRDVVKLKPSMLHPNEFVATVKLPLGVHKLLYIINSEYRVSEQLPTATDQEGIFFNWFEVLDHHHLFNHSQHQPNHTNASTDYDANIIQVAGKHDVDYINQKSNSLLAKVTKETPDFEHIEHPIEEEFREGDQQAPPPPPPPQQKEPEKYVQYHEALSTSFLNSYPTEKAITFSNEIPEMFVNYDYFKSKGPDYELPEPPQLPAHLNNVLLNKISSSQHQQQSQNVPQLPSSSALGQSSSTDGFGRPSPQSPFGHASRDVQSSTPSTTGSKRPALRRADSSYYASNKEAYHLSIPNHVILNHLMTTSIRNDVLTVACITRYSGKFVTQIMHSPADA